MAVQAAKIALAAASAAITAIDTIGQGQAANRTARYQATLMEQRAARERQRARLEADAVRNREARRRASLRARTAGSGITLEGSPLAVTSDLAADAELQALRTAEAGAFAADQTEAEARLRRAQGRNARRSAFHKAGSTLLTAGSRYFAN